jgi:uncharacterized protein YdhG (YjbR/CyaY superfamily)
MTDTKRTATRSSKGFTADERAAMQERVRELKRADKVDGESDLLAKIAEMPEGDRAMAERVHAIVKASAPELTSRTWYGMPAYAKDGDVICFFQSSHKFKARFAQLGFSDKAKLDDGDMWPIYFALKAMTPAVEVNVAALVKRAAGLWA